MSTIAVESARFLPQQGFAVYVIHISTPTTAGASDLRLAKRYSVLKSHHNALVAGSGHPLSVGFPSASSLATLYRSDPALLEERRAALDQYYKALPVELVRAMAKALISGDPGAVDALPAGGLAPDGTFESLYPPVRIPNLALTDYVLRGCASAKPGSVCLLDGPSERAILYSQLKPLIRATASGLASRGFKQGDVLAILAPNIPEYAVAFHAVTSLGGVVTTLNPLYTAQEICHQLQDAGASFLLTVGMFEEKAHEAVTGTNVTAAGSAFTGLG